MQTLSSHCKTALSLYAHTKHSSVCQPKVQHSYCLSRNSNKIGFFYQWNVIGTIINVHCSV